MTNAIEKPTKKKSIGNKVQFGSLIFSTFSVGNNIAKPKLKIVTDKKQ